VSILAFISSNEKAGRRTRFGHALISGRLRTRPVLSIVLLTINVTARSVQLPLKSIPFAAGKSVARAAKAMFHSTDPGLLACEAGRFLIGQLPGPYAAHDPAPLILLAIVDPPASLG